MTTLWYDKGLMAAGVLNLLMKTDERMVEL